MENKKVRVIFASTIRELVKQINDAEIKYENIITIIKDGEYYVHTTTPQYYKINKSDYCQFIGDNFTFNTSDPVETL